MPSSQTALCLLASMDPLVFSRSSRALLAFIWSSARSTGGTNASASGNGSNWGDVARDVLLNAHLG